MSNSLEDPLTPREQAILRRLGEDRSNADIAEVETLALSSVKWYVQQICYKLGVKNRRQAVTRARELGLLGAIAPSIAAQLINKEVFGKFPAGIVTFLFTDIQGSTPLWERLPEAMRSSIVQHHSILRQVIEANGGHVFQVIGDAFQAAFRLPLEGVFAAVAAQQALQSAQWGPTGPIRVRMGLHTGPAALDLMGIAPYTVSHTLNRAARVMAVGYGGQILLSEETASLVKHELQEAGPLADITLKDLGEHQLKGLQRMEHLYQIAAPNLPQVFPPLATAESAHDNLPRRRTSYVGREDAIALVQTSLEQSPLVTLTGSGGVGKTSLAIQVAELELDRFPDGVWFVELTPITEPGMVAKCLATALGLQEESSRSIQDTVLDYLSRKAILILLDNCEHVLDACACMVDLLLSSCSNLRLLATSREPLNVGGEKVYRVPSLRYPNSSRPLDLTSLQQFEAVRLFIDRAQAVQPDFMATAENARWIVQICQRLDGIPLAIELAAARLNVLNIDQLAGRLDHAFRLLAGGTRTAIPHHQTLRATIDWSFRLLNEAERILLRRLSVLSGTFDLEAAEAICCFGVLDKKDEDPVDKLLDLISALVNKSLLMSETRGVAGMHYRLAEIVRQYAQEKLLDSGESQQLHDRHLEYYLALAERADPHAATTDRLAWIKRLKANMENIREALVWTYQNPVLAERGLRLAAAIGSWEYGLQGYLREEIVWLQKSLECCKDQEIPPLLEMKVASILAIKYTLLNDHENRMTWSERCIQLCRSIGPQADDERSRALSMLGSCVARLNKDLVRARFLKDESVRIAQGLEPAGDFYLAFALVQRVRYISDAQQMVQDCLESYRLFYRSGDRWMASLPLWQLGYRAEIENNFSEAQQRYEEALSLAEELEDPTFINLAIIRLARLLRKMGDFAQAIAYGLEYIQSWNRMGVRERLADGFANLAISCFCLVGAQPDWCGREGLKRDALLHVTLLIAAAEKRRTQNYDFLLDQDPTLFQEALDTARHELGEGAYQMAWMRGQTMPLEEMVAFVGEVAFKLVNSAG